MCRNNYNRGVATEGHSTNYAGRNYRKVSVIVGVALAWPLPRLTAYSSEVKSDAEL